MKTRHVSGGGVMNYFVTGGFILGHGLVVVAVVAHRFVAWSTLGVLLPVDQVT